ncbi:MAG: FAD-dependent oxidoreductase [Pseudomonadota bacterium]
MSDSSHSSRKSLVFVGAGHTHALVLKTYRDDARQSGGKLTEGIDITVIDPKSRAVYSGMLPGFIAGHYTREALDIDVLKLTEPLGATFHQAAATGIDLAAKRVHLSDGQEIAYDVASIDVGITSNMPSLPGFAEHGVPAKPLASFATLWADFLETQDVPKIGVIGGGIAGAELAMAMAFALEKQGKTGTITVLDRGTMLKNIPSSAAGKVRKSMIAYGIRMVEKASIERLTESGVTLKGGDTIEANLVVGAAGATPHAWFDGTGLSLTGGYIEVNTNLQSSDPSVFAAGDCAHFSAGPLPKAGVYAVRQAPFLADNLLAAIQGRSLQSYAPQSDYLKLIALGDKIAVAEKFGVSLTSKLAWKLKNDIDAKFMTGFN